MHWQGRIKQGCEQRVIRAVKLQEDQMTTLEITELIICIVQLLFKKQQFLARNPNVKEKTFDIGVSLLVQH